MNVSTVTSLLSRGLLETTTGVLIAAQQDNSFFVQSLSTWEGAENAEFKSSTTSETQRKKIPVRIPIKRLKRLYKGCKMKSSLDMSNVSFLYSIGFALPQSEILSQAWSSYAVNTTPVIGDRPIEFSELRKELFKHIKKAIGSSSDNHYVYSQELQTKVATWSSVCTSKDGGFLVYAFSPKTKTYTLTDAYLRNEDDQFYSAYGIFMEAGLHSTPEKFREAGVPQDIGEFNISHESSRIIIPFKYEHDDLTADQAEHVLLYNLYHHNSYAGTMSSEASTTLKLRAACEAAYSWIDKHFEVVVSEKIASFANKLCVKYSLTDKQYTAERKALLKEMAAAEHKAYLLMKSRLKKHPTKEVRIRELYDEVLTANTQELQKFDAEFHERKRNITDKARRITMGRIEKQFQQTVNVDTEEKISLYRKKLTFIYEHNSSSYDSYIGLVDTYGSRLKDYRAKKRKLQQAIRDCNNDAKYKRLEKELLRTNKRITLYDGRVKNVAHLRDLFKERVSESVNNQTVLSQIAKDPSVLSGNVRTDKPSVARISKKFKVYPTALHCVTPKSSGKFKSGVGRKLKSLGFTI